MGLCGLRVFSNSQKRDFCFFALSLWVNSLRPLCCNVGERKVVCNAPLVKKKSTFEFYMSFQKNKYSGYSGESTDYTVNNLHWKTFKSWEPKTKFNLPPLSLSCGRHLSGYLKTSAEKTEPRWVIWVNWPISPLSSRAYPSPLTVYFTKSLLPDTFLSPTRSPSTAHDSLIALV